jgi:CBS domain-containing protein
MQNLTARDVMTREVRTVDADWSLDELRSFLVSLSITGAPVCDKAGKLIGVVSSTDLMRAASEGTTSSENSRHQYYSTVDDNLSGEDMRGLHIDSPSGTTVREIMTPLVFEVEPEAPIHDVADIMARGRIHRVFVLRGGKVEGVISALDLVRVLRDMTEVNKG